MAECKHERTVTIGSKVYCKACGEILNGTEKFDAYSAIVRDYKKEETKPDKNVSASEPAVSSEKKDTEPKTAKTAKKHRN